MNLIAFVETVTMQNYFEFNGKYYIQHDDLAMGSPVSSILAKVFLNDFERRHVMNANSKYESKIAYYYKYADDPICLYKGNHRQIDIFTN